MKNHILIINTPSTGGVSYFVRLIEQLRKNQQFTDIPIQLLTRQFPEGLPEPLRKLKVVHYTGYPDKKAILDATSVTEAKAIIVLSKDEANSSSDAMTFDILHRLKEAGVNQIPVIAECVNDENRERFARAGASVSVRPVRAYPEIIVRAIVAPGSEKVLENLFRHEGDHQVRFEVKLKNVTWGGVVCTLMTNGLGTAMAYVGKDSRLVCNAAPDVVIDATAVIVMVREKNIPTQYDISSTLNALPSSA